MANDGTVRSGVLAFGPFRLLPAERRLEREGLDVKIGSRALDILITLAESAGEVVSKEALTARVWPDTTVHESGLRVHIATLRKALGDGQGDARYVANVPGRGYCFVAQVVRSSLGPPLFGTPDQRDPHVAAVLAHALLEEFEHSFRQVALGSIPDRQAPAFSAQQALILRSGAAGEGRSRTRSDAALVAQICQRLDRITRAIKLAAGSVDSLSVSDLGRYREAGRA